MSHFPAIAFDNLNEDVTMFCSYVIYRVYKKKRNPNFVFNNFQSTEAYRTIFDLFETAFFSLSNKLSFVFLLHVTTAHCQIRFEILSNNANFTMPFTVARVFLIFSLIT